MRNFISAYKEKYPVHPEFYEGTNSQALKEAKRDSKLLLIYLHSDEEAHQAEVHSFCSRTLSNVDVINYINQNMLFWACDVASPQGYRVAQSLKKRTYPASVLIGLRDDKLKVLERIEGDCNPNSYIRRLEVIVNGCPRNQNQGIRIDLI